MRSSGTAGDVASPGGGQSGRWGGWGDEEACGGRRFTLGFAGGVRDETDLLSTYKQPNFVEAGPMILRLGISYKLALLTKSTHMQNTISLLL